MSCLRCGQPTGGYAVELCSRCERERLAVVGDRRTVDPVPVDRAAEEAKPKEDAEQWNGLRCPLCNCGHLPVYYTRDRGRNRIMRVRKCRHCGHKMTTYERFA